MNALKKIFLTVILSSTLGIFAQDSESITLIDFGKEKISKAEFTRVYEKNNSGEMVSKSTVDEYLELYINFKLKVLEAESKGLDTVSDFVNELEGYRRQLAQPYLSADGILEDLKKEAYERLQYDIKASHILISVSNDASPEDSLVAYKKAIKVKKLLEGGKDFISVAKEYSDDPSADLNGGDLGYFTAFYMLYPFETAAYNTKVNGISEIVRTQFGYHVIKVFDKRKAVGSVSVSHILISNDPEISKTEDPEGKINEIYKELKNGESFEKLAAQFSDDTRSAGNGGLLPTFGVSRMVPEFEDVAFTLKKPGDFSKPIKTQYGWHIIKLNKKIPIGSYESIEKDLTSSIEKDSRSNLQEGVILKRIRNQYGFSENEKALEDFYKVVDTSYFYQNWEKSKASKLDQTLFTIGDRDVNQTEFVDFLFKTQRKIKPININIAVNRKYDDFRDAQIIEYKNSKLDDEYPEFKALMQEYHDGILLFNLTNELVWTKAVSDSTGLEAFYQSKKEGYKWKERADAVVFYANNSEIAEQTRAMVLKSDSLNILEIVKEVNKSSQLNLKYEVNKYQKGENEFVDQVEWKNGLSNNIDNDGRIVFVYIKEILAPNYKTVQDSRGIITSDYQEYLEKKWIEELRAKYPHDVDQAVLKTLKTELN